MSMNAEGASLSLAEHLIRQSEQEAALTAMDAVLEAALAADSLKINVSDCSRGFGR
jgi:hypothetical protein